jgi:hypothetical protein
MIGFCDGICGVAAIDVPAPQVKRVNDSEQIRDKRLIKQELTTARLIHDNASRVHRKRDTPIKLLESTKLQILHLVVNRRPLTRMLLKIRVLIVPEIHNMNEVRLRVQRSTNPLNSTTKRLTTSRHNQHIHGRDINCLIINRTTNQYARSLMVEGLPNGLRVNLVLLNILTNETTY